MAISAEGAEAFTAATGVEGLALARKLLPDFLFLDVGLTDANGMELLREIRGRLPSIRVVVITGLATVEMAVEAMKLGAYDYLAKPHIIPQIREMIAQSMRPGPVVEIAAPADSFCGLVGRSRVMQQVYVLIDKAARSDGTVLIQGESGTGKELVARAIHIRSPRASQPFVPVDCGAIAPSVIESELFGHAAGAYTDARTAGVGLLRSAGGGTAFLDEIGELPTAVQVKLLRALQEMEVRPVGSTHTEPLGSRIIAATNLDLGQAVTLGRFRRDLFYRLHVIPIFVPPLRERREDVVLLIEHFMRDCAGRSGRIFSITPEAVEHLTRCDWPGNVRELETSSAAPSPCSMATRSGCPTCRCFSMRRPQAAPRRRSSPQARPRGRRDTCSRTERWKRSATRSARRTATSARRHASSASESPHSIAR